MTPQSRPGPIRLSDSDMAAMRAASIIRVAIAVVAAGTGLAGIHRWDRPLGTLFLIIGVVWLPWTIFLLYASATRQGRHRHLDRALYGGPAGDVAIIFAAQCLLPWAWGILLLADALTVSLAASLWRSRDAWVLLGTSVVLTMVAQGVLPAHE